MVFALAGLVTLEWLVSTHGFGQLPLDRLLRHQHDDAVKIAHRIGEVRRVNAGKPKLYVLGGSSMREAITSEIEFSEMLTKKHGMTFEVALLSSAFRSFVQCTAVIENLPEASGIVVLGVNFSRFAWDARRSGRQLAGDPFLLKTRSFNDIEFSALHVDETASLIGEINRAIFGVNSLLPGIATYLNDYWLLNRDDLVTGRLPRREYVQHRYSMTNRRSSPEKKRKALNSWLTKRAVSMDDNIDLNFSLLRQLLKAARMKRLPVVIVEQTLDHESIGVALDSVQRKYKARLKQLARENLVTYFDFESTLELSKQDFGDLAHLSAAPGRRKFMVALSRHLAGVVPRILNAPNADF